MLRTLLHQTGVECAGRERFTPEAVAVGDVMDIAFNAALEITVRTPADQGR